MPLKIRHSLVYPHVHQYFRAVLRTHLVDQRHYALAVVLIGRGVVCTQPGSCCLVSRHMLLITVDRLIALRYPTIVKIRIRIGLLLSRMVNDLFANILRTPHRFLTILGDHRTTTTPRGIRALG